MRRFLAVPLLLTLCVLLAQTSCKRPPDQGANSRTLQLNLLLPENKSTNSERKPKLTVDGKIYDGPNVSVPSAEDNPNVEVVYSFWPNGYTNIIRTRQVKLSRDKTTTLDMTNEDPGDLIKPIFVPTPPEVVTAMGKLGKIGPDDIVYDIGCGEGKMVLQAVKEYGAKKGVGIDIDEKLIEKCKQHAKDQGLGDKVEFRVGNALEIKDYSEATVVLLYLGDHLNEAIKPALRSSLKSGTRVVSHRFLMGKDWPPDQTITVNASGNTNEAETFKLHLWTIR